MKKVITTLLFVILLLGVIGSAQAASYPSVFFFSDADFKNLIIEDTVTVGRNYPIRMKWYAVYNNEGYDISVYNSSGSVVGSAYDTWTNASGSKYITVNWNTSGLKPGSYKVVVKVLFYSYYRWNEAPTTKTLYINLVCEHNWVIDEAVAPTCTKTGLTEGRHCSICKEVRVRQQVVPAKGHTIAIDNAVQPSCTQTGLTEGKHCSVCNEILVRQQVVPAKGHTVVIDNAVQPSCTQTGLTEGKHCSVCNEILVKQQIVPAKGHTEVIDKAVEATCTQTGLTEGKHCSVCNEILVSQQVVPAKGHTEVIDKAVEPTYEKTGLTEGKHCSVCGEVLVGQKVIPKLKLPTSATVKGIKYTFDNKKFIAKATGAENKAVTVISIPNTIKANGKTYTVTAIANNAFKNYSKITKVTIGKNVVSIGVNAFNGCKKLNSIIFKTTTLKTVGSNAFKGIDANATIKCPKGLKADFEKLLRKKGVPKTVTFK